MTQKKAKTNNNNTLNSFGYKELSQKLKNQSQTLGSQSNLKETNSPKKSGFLNKILLAVGFLVILSISLTGGLIAQNIQNRDSNASPILKCLDGETLSGINCISNSVVSPTYEEGCEAGYTSMQSVCVKSISKPCSDYAEAMDTEDGFCKVNVDRVLLSEVTDYDGRTCNTNAFNFKRYNVGFNTNSTEGPIVCASAFSGVFGKANFRFIPKTIIDIKNYTTTQNGTLVSACPSGYTSSNNGTECSRPATIGGCNEGGEYLTETNISCKPCPAGQYCPNNSTNAKIINICANGGMMTGDKCITQNKVSIMNYTDGCNSEYIILDKTCAIVEVRTHDFGCSYYYASDNVNVLAVLSEDGIRCSTGGRTDFESTSIIKVSDLNCDGPDSAWYNYNVAYDPLVCGKGDPSNKTGFRWSQNSYTKITGLQKLGTPSVICPNTWTAINTNDCYQPVATQEFKAVNDCPINTYCPVSTSLPIACPANTTSIVKSTKISDCIPNPVTPPPVVVLPPVVIVASSSVVAPVLSSVVVSSSTMPTPIAPVINSTPTPTPVVNTPQVVSSISAIVNTPVQPVTPNNSNSNQPANIINISDTTKPSSDTSKVNCTANPGYYFSNNTCLPCVAGYYCAGGLVAPVICPVSYYCPPVSINPIQCPVGTTTLTTGSKVLEDCRAITSQAITAVRTGGLQVFVTIFSTLLLLFFAYLYNNSKNSKGALNQGWLKVK